MEQLTCSRCGGEFFLRTGCQCSLPPPGLNFCPGCGGIIHHTAPSYVISRGWYGE